MRSPGWEKIIKDTPYRRRITQSRYPKFQAFATPEIQNNCQTVIYTDASTKLKVKHEIILDLAKTVIESKEGLAQRKHPEKRKGISHEFYFVKAYNKDVQRNIDASMEWFKAQDDFVDGVQLYENKYFCYDPQNENFQRLADFFWDRYVCVWISNANHPIRHEIALSAPHVTKSFIHHLRTFLYPFIKTYLCCFRYSQELDSWRDQPVRENSAYVYRIFKNFLQIKYHYSLCFLFLLKTLYLYIVALGIHITSLQFHSTCH